MGGSLGKHSRPGDNSLKKYKGGKPRAECKVKEFYRFILNYLCKNGETEGEAARGKHGNKGQFSWNRKDLSILQRL